MRGEAGPCGTNATWHETCAFKAFKALPLTIALENGVDNQKQKLAAENLDELQRLARLDQSLRNAVLESVDATTPGGYSPPPRTGWDWIADALVLVVGLGAAYLIVWAVS
jgi:hypothetical protein